MTPDFIAEIVAALLAETLAGAGHYLARKTRTKSIQADYECECRTLVESYAKYFIDRYDFMLAPIRISHAIPLTKVYVKPRIRPVRQSLRTLTIQEIEDEIFRGEPESFSLEQDWLQIAESEYRLLVLGRAGAGKSAFLRSIGLAHIQGRTHRSLIPFLIDSRDFATSGLDIVTYIVTLLKFGDTWKNADEFVRNTIFRGLGIILWDGLDEVGSRTLLKRTVSSIHYLNSAYPDCPQIAACRTGAYQDFLPMFKEIELAPFAFDQIEEFVHKWFADEPPKGNLVLRGIEEMGLARQMFDSPLLLTLRCLAADENSYGFQSSAHLFKTATTALLSKWDATRNVVRDQPYRELNSFNKAVLIAKIAATGIEEGSYTWSENALASTIASTISHFGTIKKKPVDGAAILRSIEAQHGILEERAREVWAFSHVALQEYFAATEIENKYDWIQLKALTIKAMEESKWRETLILVMCLKNDASPLIEYALSHTCMEIERRDFAGQIRRIEHSDTGLSSLTPHITRSICLWLVLYQISKLAAFVDRRLSVVTRSGGNDITSAMRSLTRRLCSEGDFESEARSVYFGETISRDKVYELLHEAVEAATIASPYGKGTISQEIINYFDLSREKLSGRGGFLERWDFFRQFGIDTAWAFRRILFFVDAVHSGAIMTTTLREGCIDGLVSEFLGKLASTQEA